MTTSLALVPHCHSIARNPCCTSVKSTFQSLPTTTPPSMDGAWTNMSAFAVQFAWLCLSNSYAAMKNYHIDKWLYSYDVFEEYFFELALVFAPGLLEVLQASTPPTLAFFRTLPSHIKVGRCWAVYLLILEKSDCRPRVYIGMGTQEVKGVAGRLYQYEALVNLPALVKAALDEGYDITHKGLLCWCPMPAVGTVLTPLRALFLVLESTFSLMLWAMQSRTKEYFFPTLCPWPKEDLEYDGCCSHVALSDPIRGTEIMRGGDDAAVQRAKREANLDMKRHYCATCDRNFGAHNQLQHHLTLEVHKNKVAGTTRLVKQPAKRDLHARNVASKRFPCWPCGYFGQTQQKLPRVPKTLRRARVTRTWAMGRASTTAKRASTPARLVRS
jgi:hypothetical protein